MVQARYTLAGHPLAMLTEIYIDALLVDEDAADQVWDAWDAGLIPDELAAMAWCILAATIIASAMGYAFGKVDDRAPARKKASISG